MADRHKKERQREKETSWAKPETVGDGINFFHLWNKSQQLPRRYHRREKKVFRPSFFRFRANFLSPFYVPQMGQKENIRVPCLSLFRLVPKPMPSRRSQRYISAISPFSLAPFIHLRGSLFHAGFLLKAVRNVCGERERGKKPVIYPEIRKDGEDLAFHSRESGNNNLGTL